MDANSSSNNQICLVLYFQNILTASWAESFFRFSIDLAHTLNFKINYFGIEHRCENGVLKSGKIYRFIATNLSKLHDMMAEKTVWGLSFNHSTDPDVNRNSLFISSINTNLEHKPYRLIYVEFPCSGSLPDELLADIIEKVETLAQVQYGLCTVKAREKLPAFYFLDMEVNTLEDEDVYNLNAWDRSMNQYDRTMRGLYEGNILGAGHFQRMGGSQRIKGALTEMGLNVRTLPSGNLFFSQPNEPVLLEKLRALFKPILMEIQESDKYRH